MGKDLDDDAGSSGSDGAQQSLTNRYRVHFPLTDAGGHDLIQEARDVTEKYSHRCAQVVSDPSSAEHKHCPTPSCVILTLLLRS